MDFAGPYAFYGREMLINGIQIGYCRVQPPAPRTPQTGVSPSPRTQQLLSVEWPEVRADDWCGDWKAVT